MNTWYVQLSAAGYRFVHALNLPATWSYPLGFAKYRIKPAVGDLVIIVVARHAISDGVICSEQDIDGARWYTMQTNAEYRLYNGVSNRRNWTLKRN